MEIFITSEKKFIFSTKIRNQGCMLLGIESPTGNIGIGHISDSGNVRHPFPLRDSALESRSLSHSAARNFDLYALRNTVPNRPYE